MNYKLLIYIVGILIFFLIETLYYNELLLTIFLISISIYDLIKNKLKEINLYILGLTLGTLIELYMGKITRSQYWTNTLLLDIPLWLPLAWGYGFILIYRIGKLIIKEKPLK